MVCFDDISQILANGIIECVSFASSSSRSKYSRNHNFRVQRMTLTNGNDECDCCNEDQPHIFLVRAALLLRSCGNRRLRELFAEPLRMWASAYFNSKPRYWFYKSLVGNRQNEKRVHIMNSRYQPVDFICRSSQCVSRKTCATKSGKLLFFPIVSLINIFNVLMILIFSFLIIFLIISYNLIFSGRISSSTIESLMANYFDKEEFGDAEEDECNEENNSWDSYLDTMYQIKKVMRVDLGIQCPSMSSSSSTIIIGGKESYDNSYMFPIKTCDSLFTPLSKIDKLIAKIYCSPIKRTFVYIPATLSHPKDACHEDLVHHFENCEVNINFFF